MFQKITNNIIQTPLLNRSLNFLMNLNLNIFFRLKEKEFQLLPFRKEGLEKS